MEDTVLVAYATKRGSTAQIAERVGEAIRRAGVKAEVLPVGQVSDLDRYTAVVLGSAVYIFHWRKEAVRFVEKHEVDLARVPTWIFSSGPTGEQDAEAFANDAQLPKSLESVAERIHPRGVVTFHGVIDPGQLNPLESWIIRRVEAPFGDYREWEEIEAWGTGIAETVLAARQPSPA